MIWFILLRENINKKSVKKINSLHAVRIEPASPDCKTNAKEPTRLPTELSGPAEIR